MIRNLLYNFVWSEADFVKKLLVAAVVEEGFGNSQIEDLHMTKSLAHQEVIDDRPHAGDNAVFFQSHNFVMVLK